MVMDEVPVTRAIVGSYKESFLEKAVKLVIKRLGF